MTSNSFGGVWTEQKLDVLSRYLSFYTTALQNRPSAADPFKLVYIDAFAGTGRCSIRSSHRTPSEQRRHVDGSARIALRSSRFSAFHFIEYKKRHLDELEALVSSHELQASCHVHRGKAEDHLPGILKRYDWRSHRAVLFLDPFGLECSWQVLEAVKETRALDVFFLLSLSGLFRNASINLDAVDDGKAKALTRVLGTDEWLELYKREQHDLFGSSRITRDQGWAEILDFSTRRLRSLFPEVLEPKLLRPPKGPPLYALYLAVSNPSKSARTLARKAGQDILSKLV